MAANSETIYEGIVKLRAESAQMRTDLSNAQRMLEHSLGGMRSTVSALAPALSIGGLIAFGKSVIDDAGHLKDLAAQTQLSAQFLSGIQSTLEESGSSADTFARAVFMAQKNLGGIDQEGDQAAQAIRRLGLSVDQLQKAAPEQFIELVGKALDNVTNPTERAAIGAQLFGKSWQEVGPVLSYIAGNMDKLRASGMTEADIDKLDEFGDAITRISNQLKIAAAGPLARWLDEIALFYGMSGDAKVTKDLIRVNDELDRIDKTLAGRGSLAARLVSFLNVALDPTKIGQIDTHGTDELITRRKELLDQSSKLSTQLAELNAQSSRSARSDEAGAAASARAAEAMQKEQQALLDQIRTREFEVAAIGKTGSALAELDAAQKLAALSARQQAGENAVLIGKLTELEQKAYSTKRAFDSISAGKGAVQQFEAQFGVKLDFSTKQAGADLAAQFVKVFNQMKGDTGAQEQLNKAFGSFVEQAVKMGIPDIEELLKSLGLSNADFTGLASSLSGQLNTALADSFRSGEQWGNTFDKEFSAMQQKFGQVGQSLGDLKTHTEALTAAAAEKMTMTMDTSQTNAAINEVSRQLEGIRQQVNTINSNPIKVVQ